MFSMIDKMPAGAETRQFQPEDVVQPDKKGERPNPYINSTLIEKLRAQIDAGQIPGVLLVDIDGTFEDPVPGRFELPVLIRAFCEERKIPVIAVTSRTPEMTFSTEDYEKTASIGQITRPKPHLLKTGDTFSYAPPETLPQFNGQTSFDAVAAMTGATIHVRQKDGAYMEDKGHQDRFRSNPESWRQKTLETLEGEKLLNDPRGGARLGRYPLIEDEDNFGEGKVDVAPLEWRVQIDFTGKDVQPGVQTTGATGEVKEVDELLIKEAIERKKQFLENVKNARKRRVKIDFQIDDDSNEDAARATVYILPRGAGKASAVQRFTNQIAESLGVDKGDLNILSTGDSRTDLDELPGLVSFKKNGEKKPAEVRSAVLLVGGSRLQKVLEKALKDPNGDYSYGGTNIMRYVRRLVPDPARKGHYEYHVEGSANDPLFILGFKAFEGTKQAETVFAAVKEKFGAYPTLS